MELIKIIGKDFGCFSDFELLLSKQGLVWVGGENHDTESADNNGSGKTTMFRALSWGFYGQTIDGESGNKIIRSGQTKASVQIEFMYEDYLWTVLRERKKDKPMLELIQPDGDHSSASKEDIQKQIIDMIGLDFTAFRNTVLYGQNDAIRFANPHTKDSQRKDMLHKILKTGILKHCHKWVMEKRKECKQEIDYLNLEIGGVRSKLEEIDIEFFEHKFEQFEKQRQERIEECVKKSKEHKNNARKKIKEIDSIEVEIEDTTEAEKELTRLEAVRLKGEYADKELKILAVEQDKLRDKRIDIKGLAIGTDSDTKSIDSRLRALDEDICPTCNSALNSGSPLEYKRELELEKKDLSREKVKYLKEMASIQKLIDKGKESATLLADTVDAGYKAVMSYNEINKDIAEIKNASVKAEAFIDSLSEQARMHMESARSELKRVKKIEVEENTYESILSNAKVRKEKFTKQLKNLFSKHSEKTYNLAHYEFWKHGFSGQGLPSFILDSIMPYIAERANHYLMTLSDGDITMNFETQRKLKSRKDVKDEINISWEIEGIEDFPPSGGQLKKMEIATDLALMDLVATREKGNIDILILDEVLDGLDAEGCQRVLTLLQELRSKHSSIFVISHQTEISEIFEKSIFAVKKGGSSLLKVA